MNPNHPFTPEEIIILASIEEAVGINRSYSSLYLIKKHFVFNWFYTDEGFTFWHTQELRFQEHNYKIARR